MDELTKDILDTAKKRMKIAADVAQIHNERGESDLRFATGEGQWPEADRTLREAENKPTLTFNMMPQSIRRVTGQIRQINPAIKVSAADDEANEDVAGIHEGLIREIEYRCDAQSIYEATAESAAQCSIGHFRIRSEYCDYDSFNQHILIERIFNPFAVFFDPMSKEPTRKDADFVFIIEEMERDDFKAAYPDADLQDWKDSYVSVEGYQWVKPETVVVAEYYWREFEEYEIAVTASGSTIRGPLPKGVEFERKRKVRKPKIMWAKINGDEILEGPKQVPGDFIPVVAVTGEEIHIGEETYRSGVIRFAKDDQICYNIARNASIETTLLQPRAPYIGTVKQFTGLEDLWAKANTANRPYIPYNADPQAPGAPQRQPPPIASQGLITEAQIAADGIKSTTGIHDASLGARSNETSGIAIQQRQNEADISTSVYSDNMVKAVAHAGRIIVSMIPHIYDTERTIRILGEDDQEKIVAINKMLNTVDGTMTENDMTVGKYAVRVSVGPTYASKKQEASAGMMDFMSKIPQSAPIISDLIAGAQEWPDADRIAARLKKTVPQELVADEDKDDQDPEQMARKQMEMQQQQQAAQQQAQLQKAQLQIAMRKAAAEASEAEAQAVKAQADAAKAEADAKKAMIELLIAESSFSQNAGQPPLIPAPQGNPVQGTY